MNFSKYRLQKYLSEGQADTKGTLPSLDASRKATTRAINGVQNASQQQINNKTQQVKQMKQAESQEHFRTLMKEKEMCNALKSQKSNWRQELQEKVVDGQEREQHPYVTVMPTGDENLIQAMKQTGQTAKKKKDAVVGEGYEQLDEISKELATKAYAERRTNEFEGDELHTKSDKTHKRIVNKFGKKAGEDADKAANKKIFGEEASDAMKDRRMMRGGVDGNTRYDRAPKPSRSSRQPKGGDSSFDAVAKQLKGQYGDKSIMASKRTIKK